MTTSPPPTLPIFTDSDVTALFNPSPSPSPPYSQSPSLLAPICIPQLNPTFDSPFIRAYAPALGEKGISKEEWLGFLDGLNLALVGSPPLQVVDKIGMAIGMVPNHWFMIASIAIQTSAQTGLHIISKSLTDKYLLTLNKSFFSPRRLVVRLLKTPALKLLLADGATPDSKLSACGKSAGKTALTVGLHLPILRKIIVGVSAPAIKVDVFDSSTVTSRKIESLQESGMIAPLDLNVPAPPSPEGMMNKASSLAIKLRTWKESRTEGKADRARRVLAIQESGGVVQPASSSGVMGFIDGRKERKASRRAAKDAWKGRGPNPRRIRKLQTKVDIEDKKEELRGDRSLWLVVMNLEDDEKIDGREWADGEEDYLEIGEEEWEEELEAEAEEDVLVDEIKEKV